jgi:hypothetical protein
MPTTPLDDEGDEFARSVGRRHEDTVQVLRYFELRLKTTEREIAELNAQISSAHAWIAEHKAKVAWIEENREYLMHVIDGTKWASQTRKVIAFIVASAIGAIMFAQSIWPFFEERMKP